MQTWKRVSVLSLPLPPLHTHTQTNFNDLEFRAGVIELTFKDYHNVMDPVIISDLLRVYTLRVRLGGINLDSSIPL